MPAEAGERQHKRLENLADVVYGVAIVLLVAAMPTPHSEGLEGTSLVEFLAETYELILGSAVGLFLVGTYWLQNNAVNGILSHTDTRHSSLVLLQLVVMLLYFYAIGLGEDLDHAPGVLVIQSATLALMGAAGISGLAYASGRGRLVRDDVEV